MAGARLIEGFRPTQGSLMPVSLELPFLYPDDAQVKLDALNNLSEK